MTEDILIVAGARTAIGDFGGGLKDVPPAELGATVIAEAIRRAAMTPADIEHVVMGQVIPTLPSDAYLARVAAVRAGIPHGAPALTLNRLCGSGLQAVISASQMIALGEIGVAVAGGAESMSRAPYLATGMRWGTKMGDTAMLDMMVGALSDPFEAVHMGVTAENVSAKTR